MSEKFDKFLISDLMSRSGVAFGTSGARGRVESMTDRVCYSYVVGFLQFLERTGAVRPGDPVVVAGDYRPSTPRIAAAAMRAIADLGYVGENAGSIPTPALAAYAMAKGAAGVMVTGSHIPDERNGIKFYKPDGEVLKEDETGIREQLVSVPCALFDDDGAFVEPFELPAEDRAACRHYVSRYLDFFPSSCLAGYRVLVYEHSTVAAGPLVEIFSGLGADVIRRGYSETFVPVDTEAIRAIDSELAAQWAAEGRIDAIVSADGDGDRPLLSDEHGEWLRGDILGILVARYLDADVVVTPVSSNSAVERSGWFDNVVRTRIGSPYVIAAMQEAADGGASTVVGYEANGGFLLQTPLVQDGRRLAPLPTRDAALVPIAVLLLARARGVPVSQLATLLPPRFTASERIREFPTAVSERHISELADDAGAIARLFPGHGEVRDVDMTDGLRVTFANDEVIHLRPSGNAPELRCYAEADSASRAKRLTADSLARLDAWRE
jgi:phosphomannomutase